MVQGYTLKRCRRNRQEDVARHCGTLAEHPSPIAPPRQLFCFGRADPALAMGNVSSDMFRSCLCHQTNWCSERADLKFDCVNVPYFGVSASCHERGVRLTRKVTGDHGGGEAPPAGVRVDRRVRPHPSHRICPLRRVRTVALLPGHGSACE